MDIFLISPLQSEYHIINSFKESSLITVHGSILIVKKYII